MWNTPKITFIDGLSSFTCRGNICLWSAQQVHLHTGAASASTLTGNNTGYAAFHTSCPSLFPPTENRTVVLLHRLCVFLVYWSYFTVCLAYMSQSELLCWLPVGFFVLFCCFFATAGPRRCSVFNVPTPDLHLTSQPQITPFKAAHIPKIVGEQQRNAALPH